jgi:DNA-binding transcriptional ArsR family regulator
MSIRAAALVEMAKALGHQARLRILAMLREGPLCVCQITSVLGLASSTVSEHLSELRRAGWVFEEKRGKWVFYQLTETEPLRQLAEAILQLVGADPQLREDAEVIRALRTVPVDDLCRAGLDLAAVGVKRVRSATPGEVSDSGPVGGGSQ